jgi:hypothetical protein
MLNTSTYLYIAFYLIYGSNIAVTIDLTCHGGRDARTVGIYFLQLLMIIINILLLIKLLRYWYDIVGLKKKYKQVGKKTKIQLLPGYYIKIYHDVLVLR